MARSLIVPALPLVGAVFLVGIAFVGCTAPEESFNPTAACEELCTKTGQCGWANEIDFEQTACENRCLGRYNDSLAASCDDIWEATIRCTQREYTCSQVETLPCVEDNARLSECLGEDDEEVVEDVVPDESTGGAGGSSN